MSKIYRILSFVVIAFVSLNNAYAYFDTGESTDESPYIPVIMIVEDDEEAADLEAQGVIIWHRRADMAIALIPKDLHLKQGRYGKPGHHKKMPRGNKMIPVMDIAKTHFDGIKIQQGVDLPQPYTGKGVVVGFCDLGFDPHHINFADSEGKTRVRKIVCYDEPQGLRQIMDSPEEIEAWATDNSDETHATHVAGIMTGSYNVNGYGGMAPDAEIVATTSKLYDAGILAGCEEIIAYAKSVGKPAVINLSVGSYNGPHDGSTLFNKYMALMGEEAIICMAAGNEGSHNNTYQIKFGDDTPSWKMRIHSFDYVQYDMYGLTDVWSADSRPVGIKFHIFDEFNNVSVFESELLTEGSAFPVSINSEDNPNFARYMTGEVLIDGYVEPSNGRWVTEISYDTHTDESNPNSGSWARYNLALEISGNPGVKAYVTTDSQYSRLVSWPGYPAGNSDLSVSDIATGDNVVCVGMYNNRDELPQLNGDFKSSGLVAFDINKGSGYGTLVDGRVLPHTVAPGGGIISSASGPYVSKDNSRISQMNVAADIGANVYYWNNNTGTSMSTPYLAGVIATWLEADPTLTVVDVKRILSQTNATDCYDKDNPRNGLGWLRPYEGLKKILSDTAVSNGRIDAPSCSIVFKGGHAEILNPDVKVLKVDLSSLDGISMASDIIIDSPVGIVDLSFLPKGVYIMSVHSELQKPVLRKFIR